MTGADISEDLYAAFIQKNADRYLIFDRFVGLGKNILSFNLAAVIFGPAWFLWRKMFLAGLGYLLFLGAVSNEFLSFYLDLDLGFGYRGSNKIVLETKIIVGIIIGVIADYLYYPMRLRDLRL